jgi:hypothetical protein
MAKKAIDDPTPSSQVGRQPAVVFPAVPPERVRLVAALPLDKFMPLIDAFVQAENRLGSGELAAHDLTDHARAGRLTVAARWVERGGLKQAGVLRSAFWQSFKIWPDRLERVCVRGPLLAGHWTWFVGRRRFDRLYSIAVSSTPVAQHSTAVSSKPAAQRSSPKSSQSQDDRRLTLLSDEPQFEERIKWRREDAMKWLADQFKGDTPKSGERSAWARRKYLDMVRDFGENIPWQDWEVLRRRMNDL